MITLDSTAIDEAAQAYGRKHAAKALNGIPERFRELVEPTLRLALAFAFRAGATYVVKMFQPTEGK